MQPKQYNIIYSRNEKRLSRDRVGEAGSIMYTRRGRRVFKAEYPLEWRSPIVAETRRFFFPPYAENYLRPDFYFRCPTRGRDFLEVSSETPSRRTADGSARPGAVDQIKINQNDDVLLVILSPCVGLELAQ